MEKIHFNKFCSDKNVFTPLKTISYLPVEDGLSFLNFEPCLDFDICDVVDFVLPACPRDLQGLWAAVMAQLRPGSGGPVRAGHVGVEPRGRRGGPRGASRRPRPY